MSDSTGYRDPFDSTGTEVPGPNGGMPPQFWNNLLAFGAATMQGANARTPQGFLANGSGPLGPLGVGLQAGLANAHQMATSRSALELQGAQRANLLAEAGLRGAQLSQTQQAIDLLNQYMKNSGGLPLASGAPGTQPVATGQADAGGGGGDFIPQLYKAESGLNPGKVNDQGYAGLGQFGAGRLATLGVYNPASGEDLKANQWKGGFNIPGHPDVKSLPDFLKNPDAQNAVMNMHLADIDQNIAQTPGAGNFDPNGLRAVAHLGGVGGMQKFVSTNGQSDPGDANGTKLSDYYRRFSAPSGGNSGRLANTQPTQQPYQVAQAGGQIPGPPQQPVAPLQMAPNLMPSPEPWNAGVALGNRAAIMGLNPYMKGFASPLEEQSKTLLGIAAAGPTQAAKSDNEITMDRFGNRYRGNVFLGRGAEVKEVWNPATQQYEWGDVGALGANRQPLSGENALPAKPSPMATEFMHERGKGLGEQFDKIDHDAASSIEGNYLFDNLRNDSKSWDMGKFADIEGNARAWLSATAGLFGIDTPQLNAKLADFQAFNKSSGMLLRTAVHDTSSRAAVQEFKLIGDTLPTPTTSERGFGQIADQWQGLNDFRLAKQKVMQGFQGNPQDFNVSFNSNVSPTAFMLNRMDQTPAGKQDAAAMIARMQESPEGRLALTHMMKGYNFARQNRLFDNLPPMSAPTQTQP